MAMNMHPEIMYDYSRGVTQIKVGAAHLDVMTQGATTGKYGCSDLAVTDECAFGNKLTTLGTTLLSNGDFATNDLTEWTAADGWSAATGKAVHTAGTDTTVLLQSVSLTATKVYEVMVVTTGRTAGTLTLTLGALSGSAVIASNTTTTQRFTATDTEATDLKLTPTATFDGAVASVTCKLVTITMEGALGFYGAIPATQPEITGSTTDTTVASILAALEALGLVKDSTT